MTITLLSGDFRRFRFALVALATLWLASCATPPAPSSQPQPRAPLRLSLIAINDFHGHLLPSGLSVAVRDPASGRPERVPAGGGAYLATLLEQLQAENPGRSLVVGGGDLVGASPPVSGLFHDEPTIEYLNAIGLSLSTVGNHEFDKGRDELLRLQRGGCFPASADGRGVVGVDTCLRDGRFEGARFAYLAANVIERRTGEPLLPAIALRRIGGVPVGFIGVVLKGTPAIVNPAGVAGLSFADEVATVNRWVPELKRQGAAVIVVLLHQGGATAAEAINDPNCPELSGPALRIVDAFDPAVEVVISGHTHKEYICRRPDGRLLTQAGSYGRMATKIDLDVDPATGRVLAKAARNHVAVNDSAPRAKAWPAGQAALARAPAADALIGFYAAKSAAKSGRVVGHLDGPLSRTPNAAGESPLGDVIADAYLFASSGPGYDGPPAQIAFVNPGGLRGDLPAGSVTYGQLHSVHPFGNTLVSLDLSGAEIARLLEQQWEKPQPTSGRILSVSAGLSYRWDARRPEGAPPGQGRRLVAGSLRLHGRPIEPGQSYRVTVNSYLASGGDRFEVFKHGRNVQENGLDVDALSAYLESRRTLPVPAADRIRRVE